MQKVVYPVICNDRLPFYLTGIGISDPEYNIVREMGLSSYQFLFTLEGRGILEIDGERYVQTQGDCFFLAPHVPHSYYPEKVDWKTAWLVFRGRELGEIMPRLGFERFDITHNGCTTETMMLFERIMSAARAGESERSSAAVYELVLTMEKHFFAAVQNTEGADIATAAVEYINANYAQDITLSMLAENSGVSEQHLCRMFRKRLGMRPVEYLNRCRIAVAKELLLDDSLSVTDVAESVGYSSPTYFGMVFRRLEGVTATEFRRSRSL